MQQSRHLIDRRRRSAHNVEQASALIMGRLVGFSLTANAARGRTQSARRFRLHDTEAYRLARARRCRPLPRRASRSVTQNHTDARKEAQRRR